MNEEKKQHLEFLHNNIARMNQCSFHMKEWTIAIVTALIAAYVATISNCHPGNKLFIFIAIAPTAVFWILDSLYLSKERKFIGIYNDVAGVSDLGVCNEIKEYDMPLKKYKKWKYCIFKAILSPSEIILYGLIIVGLVLFGIFA